ncbi:uncharacterized protein LOC108743168 isoform X2 [Agrilus planipennis]|uniref:Uncharacterized protein LOC108743168 isoform X2 n=1 Tax=Agrilus planipennis TaxID=224129 RepID=A0A1W4XDB6_AGRPL|nr:uncharacterized protein LOC108743168 isoform X2 [Agrilus planipennis]
MDLTYKTDTGRSRLEQHRSKNAVLRGFQKKKRAIKGSRCNRARTLSDPRPQTRRNLSDVPTSQQNRSLSTKRWMYNSDIKKKSKQLSSRIGSSASEQKEIGNIESDSLNNTDNEDFEMKRINPAPEEITPSVIPKSETYDYIPGETITNITTCVEKVVEDKNYTCINEHEYSQFLLRITEDIIRNECYTMEMILNVFKSHIEANKSQLDLGKMLSMIKQLCSEINFPLEVKQIEDFKENEQCRVCCDYSCENMSSKCTVEEPENVQGTIFEKCKAIDALPQNQEKVDTVNEIKSPDVPIDNGQTKSPKCLLSEKLRRCIENDGETTPKMKKEPEEINRSLRHKNEEKCGEMTITTYELNKEKIDCEPEQKWNKDESALPVHYVNQLENCLKQMKVYFTQISQANVGQPQTPAICNAPQVPMHYPDKCIKNNFHQREQCLGTYNYAASPAKHYCKRCQMCFRQKTGNKNELPTTYPFGLSYECHKNPVKNDVESKRVMFCNLSSACSSDISCNENPEEVVEVIKLPNKAFVDESCFDKNSIHLSPSNNTTCDLSLDTNKTQCKGMEIQIGVVDETKNTVKEKNQPVQQRAVGIQWGKCSCLNNKGNQTGNFCSGTTESSPSKIVPKSIDASTQYAKTERGCPSSSEYYKKKSAKECPEKVDASVQYEKEANTCKKTKTVIAKNDIENLNSHKERSKICREPSENNGWNSKIVEYKLLLQDLFRKCETQCADADTNLIKDVKENVKTKISRCKKNNENDITDKDSYKINEYKSMLQDLFQKCYVSTQDQAPMGKVDQATNALPELLLENYEIKARQKSTVPTKSYCPSKAIKEDEIFISPAYENWSVSAKDAKFSREVAHQYPQIKEDFHVTVMHDAFTSMSNKELFTSPYCNSLNRICDKGENFLLDRTYEKSNRKENTVLPLTLAAFFPNAETQTTDIDRHLAARLIMSVQEPTKDEVPKKGNYDISQRISVGNVEEVSQKGDEVQNRAVEKSFHSAMKLKKESQKLENKDRKKNLNVGSKTVSVGNTVEVPFTFENNIKGYRSEPLPVDNVPEDSIPENSQGANNVDEDLKDNNGGSEEIEVENVDEEDWNEMEDINEPHLSELLELKGERSRKSSGASTNKEIEKEDEPILSDESDYNCCGRKKIYTSDMTSRNDRTSTRGSIWSSDKQTVATDANASPKNTEMLQITRDVDKQETLKKSDKRLADRNIDIELIKKRFDRSSLFVSNDFRTEQTMRKTLSDKGAKDRTRAKSYYVDEENLEVITTRSKKRNTLMLPQDENVSIDS